MESIILIAGIHLLFTILNIPITEAEPTIVRGASAEEKFYKYYYHSGRVRGVQAALTMFDRNSLCKKNLESRVNLCIASYQLLYGAALARRLPISEDEQTSAQPCKNIPVKLHYGHSEHAMQQKLMYQCPTDSLVFVTTPSYSGAQASRYFYIADGNSVTSIFALEGTESNMATVNAWIDNLPPPGRPQPMGEEFVEVPLTS